MIQYSEFQPTGFDARGLGCHERQDWFVAPCGTNRDAELGTESNWEVQKRELARLDPEGNDHEEHEFGHWANGWFRIVLVRPGSACAELCEGFENALSDYPLLDDSDHSDREWEAEQQAWRDLGTIKARREVLRRAGMPENLACRQCPPSCDNGALRERLLGY